MPAISSKDDLGSLELVPRVLDFCMQTAKEIILGAMSIYAGYIGNFIKWGEDIDHMTSRASGIEITQCNKINKPLVVYRFSGNVMTPITTLRI